MKLTMLGTGNALVTECYNTCFVLSDEYGHFLVDGGGGNTVLSQLKKAGVDLMDVHEIFVTHKHVDHIMGDRVGDPHHLPEHEKRHLSGRGKTSMLMMK